MRLWLFHIGFAIMLSFSTLGAQNCAQPYGKWVNENGSVLEITERSEQGLLQGTYQSHEGTEGQEFTVLGWWPQGDTVAVSFSVYWKAYGTITSWTGMCRDKEVEVLWHHVDPEPRFDFQQWSTQRSRFRPLSPKAEAP